MFTILEGFRPTRGDGDRWCECQHLAERFRHTLHRRVPSVFHLDPMLRPAALVGPVAPFRHQPFKAEFARLAK